MVFGYQVAIADNIVITNSVAGRNTKNEQVNIIGSTFICFCWLPSCIIQLVVGYKARVSKYYTRVHMFYGGGVPGAKKRFQTLPEGESV